MPALFVEQLTVIDFSYLHPSRGLLGESWIVDLELEGDLDDQGMVFDFGPVKKQIKQAVDAVADHKLLVPTLLPGLSVNGPGVQGGGDALEIEWRNPGFPFLHSSPEHAVLLLECETLTCEFLAEELEKAVLAVVPTNVTSVNLKLYPEDISGAFYHYSHGLKKHLGDCQRIAHGHRSKIHVMRNGERDSLLEAHLSKRFEDIYLATEEDRTEQLELEGQACSRFAYESEQGCFSIALPTQRCFLLVTDTTVELIASSLLQIVQESCSNDAIEIIAYEGVGKGAIARNF